MQRLPPLIRWTRASAVLLSGFFFVIFLIVYIWWPLAEQVLAYVDWHGQWWLYMDWLLIGIFLFMSLTIVARADLRLDAVIVIVATIGGLVIEAWGTQTNLWHYYTSERPPLWIVPAWPIATLSIDRITHALAFLSARGSIGTKTRSGSAFGRLISLALNFRTLYWIVFIAFLAMMFDFVAPTFHRSYTILAGLLCVVLVFTPTDHRHALLTFVAGAGLGYFLELWGTTRECWTYYTYETPPAFAVVAHGMASVAFWRAGLLLKLAFRKLRSVQARRAQALSPQKD